MEFKRRNDGSQMGGGPQAKWAKKNTEWEDSPSQFEEELSMFIDADMDIEDQEGQASHDVIPVGVYFTENHTILNLTSIFLKCISSILLTKVQISTCQYSITGKGWRSLVILHKVILQSLLMPLFPLCSFRRPVHYRPQPSLEEASCSCTWPINWHFGLPADWFRLLFR